MGYEYWNLIAVLMQVPPFSLLLRKYRRPVGYFTFGANLDPEALNRRRIKVLERRELLLRNHELRFTQPGPGNGLGFASVQARPGKLVYGHLLTIRLIDAIRLDFAELLPVLRRRRRVWVTQQGRTFYFYQSTCPQEGLAPSKTHHGKILRAAESSALIPKEMLAELRQTPTSEAIEETDALHLIVSHYERWPAWLIPLLRKYDRLCSLLLWRLLRPSLLERLIKL